MKTSTLFIKANQGITLVCKLDVSILACVGIPYFNSISVMAT